MKKFHLFWGFIFYLNSFFAQEAPIESRAFQLDRFLANHHVTPSFSTDTIANRFTTIFLDLLDPDHTFFLKSDLNALKVQCKNICKEFQTKDLYAFKEVDRVFSQRLESYENFLKTLSLTKWNSIQTGIYTNAEQLENPTEQSCKEKWMRELQCKINDQVFDLGQKNGYSSDSIKLYVQRAFKRTVGRELELVQIKKNETRYIETYYLMAYALSFDPHSMYLNQQMQSNFRQELSSEIERFGFNFNLNDADEIVISELMPGSPAWLSGDLKVDDRLIRVGFYEGKELRFQEVEFGIIGLERLNKAFGNYQDKRIVLIVKNTLGLEKVIELKKSKVFNDNELVKNVLISGQYPLGYIYLPDFYTDFSGVDASKGCASDLAKCILKLKKDSIQGLILDLRGNTGGSLLEAIALAGMFIDYGPVGAQLNRLGEANVYKDLNRGLIYDGPLMIMIDENSASASELLAGVLQDYKKAIIVGQQSYGKATGQSGFDLHPMANLFDGTPADVYGFANITQFILYRVTGESNQARGVIPDIEIGNNFDRNDLQVEENELGALKAPVYPKKINFTPSSKELPIMSLQAEFDQIKKEKWFYDYSEKVNSLIALSKAYEPAFSFSVYKEQRMQLETLLDAIENLQQSLTWNELISSNSFDLNMYQQNNILHTYFENFVNELKQDVELKAAVQLMNKWISLN